MLRRAMQTTRGRLVLLLSTVGAVIVLSAVVDHLAFDRYATFGEALWSATLHLLDPSALQDDQGAVERTIGIFQVITGLVLLVGVLFTLVADSVGSSIERLGRLDPPVRGSDHLLVVGGSDLVGGASRALALASELSDERPRVVALAPESARPGRQRMLAELRSEVAPLKVDLVFGDTSGADGFQLAGAERASTIVVLPSAAAPTVAEAADVEVMQAGLALMDYLEHNGGSPEVRLLFRRGRHVDAAWDLFPPGWDAVVGDRIVAAVLRVALTMLEQVPEIDALVDVAGGSDKALLSGARQRAAEAGRPIRLTVVGCGLGAPALIEDLAAGGGEELFDLTMLAERDAFEANLGSEQRAGFAIRYRETRVSDPEHLAAALQEAGPDMVIVTPSPTASDTRLSDAEATLAVLHVLRQVSDSTPVLAELFHPDSVERLPRDPRLMAVSALEAVAGALAMTIFDPDRSQRLESDLASEPGMQGSSAER